MEGEEEVGGRESEVVKSFVSSGPCIMDLVCMNLATSVTITVKHLRPQGLFRFVFSSAESR